MITILLIMLTATCLSCAFAVLLLTKSRNVQTDRPLAVVFIVLGIGTIDGLMTLTIPSWANNLSGISLPLIALCGPMLVFHLNAVSCNMLAVGTTYAYMSKPAWFFSTLCLTGFLTIYVLHAMGIRSPMLGLMALLIGLSISAWTVFHIVKGMKLIRQRDVHLARWFSRIDDKSLAWVRSVLTFSIVIILIDFLLMFLRSYAESQSLIRSYNLVFLCAVVIVFAYKAILHRVVTLSANGLTSEEIIKKTAYSNSGLAPAHLDRLLKKLDVIMDTEKLYLDPDISLPRIANSLGTTTNHLSQAINQGRGLTFLDYINLRRIEEARTLIQTTSHNFLNIAFASGFNSRSTFNAAFRKHVNTTPSQYRRNIASEPIGPGDFTETTG